MNNELQQGTADEPVVPAQAAAQPESKSVDRGTLWRALGLIAALACIAWIVRKQSS